MDIIEIPGLPFPAMPPSARVLLVLAKYAALGVIPMVIPSILDIPPLPIERIPQQRGSDFAYVSRLARQGRIRLLPRAGPVPARPRPIGVPRSASAQPSPR